MTTVGYMAFLVPFAI